MKIASVRAIPMSAPNCHILEVSQGYMPMMNELFSEPYGIRDGTVHAPQSPGLGFTLRDDAFDRFEYVPGPEFIFKRASGIPPAC